MTLFFRLGTEPDCLGGPTTAGDPENGEESRSGGPEPAGTSTETTQHESAVDSPEEHDVEVGQTPVSHEQALRVEAKSVQHMLTHKPKNPFCSICDRAKARQSRASFQRELHEWGGLVTVDHIDSRRAEMMGLNGE